MSLELVSKQILAPSQTRIVPIKVTQYAAFEGDTLSFRLFLSPHIPHDNKGVNVFGKQIIDIEVEVKHLPFWTESRWDSLLASFFFHTFPTLFLVKPPMFKGRNDSVPILALRESAHLIIQSQ